MRPRRGLRSRGSEKTKADRSAYRARGAFKGESVGEIPVERSGAAQRAVAAVPMVIALAFLGWVLAYWTWAWFAPRPEASLPLIPDTAVRPDLARRMFGSSGEARAVAAATGMAIKLQGIVAASPEQRGYAVFRIEPNEILAVEEGNEIVPGVRLAEIRSNQVTLVRDGLRETLTWPEKPSPARAAQSR